MLRSLVGSEMCIRDRYPDNFNAAVPEHNHIWLAKRPGRRSVKHHSTFNRQVARRLSDALIINAADNIMSPEAAVEAGSITSDSSHDEDAIVETYKGATVYTVTLTNIQHATADSDGQAQYAVNWYTKTDIAKLHIDTTLAAYIHYVIYGEPTDIVMNRSVTVCTEYQRNDIPF